MQRVEKIAGALKHHNELNLKHIPWKLCLLRYRTRQQLKALSINDPERVMQDLGLDRNAVREECKKWFWQA